MIVPDWNAPPHVHALVTTRSGGVSAPPYDGFNLAAHVGDDPASVAENRRRLRAVLPAEPLWLDQVHGTRILSAEAPGPDLAADACVARSPGRVLAVLVADCLPVLLTDDAGRVVAAAHAGWRGLAAGVVEKTVAAMGIAPGRLLAWLGPGIGRAAFEVGPEVCHAFCDGRPEAEAAFIPHRGGKWLCDLAALARLRLGEAGVERIFGGDLCTHADSARFYSYRRDGATGRMAALLWLE